MTIRDMIYLKMGSLKFVKVIELAYEYILIRAK